MASITAHPSQPGTLIFSNPHTLPPPGKGAQPPKSKAAKGKRENLSIKLSRDDGKTWSINKTLEGGPSAYSDLAVLPDGVIHILYDRERAKEREILMARFTEADVLAGKLVSPGSQTKMLVSKARGPR